MRSHSCLELGAGAEGEKVLAEFEDTVIFDVGDGATFNEVIADDADGAPDGVEQITGPQTGPQIWDGINGESSIPIEKPIGPKLYSSGSKKEMEPLLFSNPV